MAAQLHRAGHEAGSLSPWLQREVAASDLPPVSLDTFAAATR